MDIRTTNPELFKMAQKGTVIRCEECGMDYFHPVFVLVKIDKLISGWDKDKVIPLQAFKCAHCGHVNRDFDPLTDNDSEEIIKKI